MLDKTPLSRFAVTAQDLAEALAPLELADRLVHIVQTLPGKAIFTTSFGLEDQALTHVILTRRLPIEIVTLDTGRLFPQTYDLWAQTEEKYTTRIKAFYPNAESIEHYVTANGINGFRQSVELRKSCCFIRKVEPLSRALDGATAWITGLRSGQSANRAKVELAEEDQGNNLIKINPLADWSKDQLFTFIHALEIPYNDLHDKGFPSIGCAPCTRAVKLGEDERAGRWWWENEDKKECGLHLRPGPSEWQGEAI